ncbi:MAG: 2-dehydropantoate 2-reductase [Candidatus Delongbacteria bacterium]|nr:2-dehydropantoate 2-reductase [Candidatus Delongbacteria bacterium]
MKNKFVILGAGGVGTAIGAALAEKYYEDTLLIARKEHAFALNLKGCGITGSVHKTVRVRAAEEIDFLLENSLLIVAVKITVLEETLRQIHPYITDTTSILLVQNGYGVKNIANRALFGLVDQERIFQAIATLGAVLRAPGQLELYPGGLKAEKAFSKTEYAGIFEGTFLDYKVTSDLEKAVWIKLIINSIVNPLSVIFRAKNKVIAENRLDGLKDMLLKEGLAVVKTEGHDINLTVPEINDFIRSDNRTSMLQDYFHKRPNEIDFINGAIISVSEKHGICVPANRLIYGLVKNIEKNRIEDKEEKNL